MMNRRAAKQRRPHPALVGPEPFPNLQAGDDHLAMGSSPPPTISPTSIGPIVSVSIGSIIPISIRGIGADRGIIAGLCIWVREIGLPAGRPLGHAHEGGGRLWVGLR